MSNKISDYCVIDHMGSIVSKYRPLDWKIGDPDPATDALIAKLYKRAYSLTKCKDTFTIKKLACLLSSNPATNVTDKQKNFIRFNKHPKQVLFITPELNSRTEWFLEQWFDNCQDITIIECVQDNEINVQHISELHPEWFNWNDGNSIYRRCASIWGKALGWTFSNPIYRDLSSTWFDEKFCMRPDRKLYQNDLGMSSHLTVTYHNPDSYLRAHNVATEKECQEFFQYYKYLRTSGILAESLEPDYYLCPNCQRPVRISQEHCDTCDTPNPHHIEIDTFYEDSYLA